MYFKYFFGKTLLIAILCKFRFYHPHAFLNLKAFVYSLFRIHDILVWIRIRIHRSMPLTNGSGCGSGTCYFRHWPSRGQQKTNLKKFFCLLLFEGTFTSFFKDKNSESSQYELRFFLHFLLGYRRMMEGSGSGRPKNMWIRWILNTAVEGHFFTCSCVCRNRKSGNKRSGTNRTELEGWWCIQSLTCTWDWWELQWSSFLSSSSHSCSKLVSSQLHFQIVQIFYSYNCFLFLHTCLFDLHNECTSL